MNVSNNFVNDLEMKQTSFISEHLNTISKSSKQKCLTKAKELQEDEKKPNNIVFHKY